MSKRKLNKMAKRKGASAKTVRDAGIVLANEYDKLLVDHKALAAQFVSMTVRVKVAESKIVDLTAEALMYKDTVDRFAELFRKEIEMNRAPESAQFMETGTKKKHAVVNNFVIHAESRDKKA
jgi:hypothetical protein